MTSELTLKLPIRVSDDAGVTALLFNGPSQEHHHGLNRLRFTQFGYSDERLGRVETLTEAIALNTEHGNNFWQMKTINELASDTVIGDLFTHVRAYLPATAGARMVGMARAKSGAKLERFEGGWAVWARVTVEAV